MAFSLKWIACVAACVAGGCYSEPSVDGGTEDGSSTGSGPSADDGDDGSSMTASMSASTTTPPPATSDDDSSGGPGSTGEPPMSTTDTGVDESTGAVVDGSSSGELETTGDGSSSDDATTGPVVPPGECNEMLDVGCDTEQFCNYPDDMCGAGSNGVCVVQPMICNLILQPSCGCNGSNYSNPCVATANGTDFAHFGNC